MSTEENKAIVRRLTEELWNGRNAEVIDELVAENYTGNLGAGRRAWKEIASAVFAAAPPDLHVTIEDQIAEEDKVVTRYTWSFTHTVPFLDAAPTGKHISWTGINICRLELGKIVKDWANHDELGRQRQLGLIA